MSNFDFILANDALNVISFITNIVFVTWGIASLFQGRKHKKELANIFDAEYNAAKALADFIKDETARLHINHMAEFLRAITGNFKNRYFHEADGYHYNIIMRCVEKFLSKDRKQ